MSKEKKKFKDVDLFHELRSDSNGCPVFRRCFEHETLMSFNNDSGNYAFLEWWPTEGAYLFNEWLKKSAEFYDDANL